MKRAIVGVLLALALAVGWALVDLMRWACPEFLALVVRLSYLN